MHWYRHDQAAANLQGFVEDYQPYYSTINDQVKHEEISPNRQLGNVFTKPNEAYQTSAAIIKSKENEVYEAADTEVFTKPNEAYHNPWQCSYNENEAYGATSVEL